MSGLKYIVIYILDKWLFETEPGLRVYLIYKYKRIKSLLVIEGFLMLKIYFLNINLLKNSKKYYRVFNIN